MNGYGDRVIAMLFGGVEANKKYLLFISFYYLFNWRYTNFLSGRAKSCLR